MENWVALTVAFFFFNGENGIVYPLIGQQLDVLLTTSFDYPDVLLTVVDG